MKKVSVAVIALMCFVSLFAFAGDTPKAPKYISVQNVTIAGDKSESYLGLVAQFRQAAETVKSDSYWITASSFTGDLRQLTFVSMYDSFAAFQKDIDWYPKISEEVKRINPNFWKETGAAELQPTGSIAVIREDLSYHPDKISAAETKWWHVKTIHLAPGHRTAFADLMKEEIELLNKAKVDESFTVYEVMAGVPTTGQVYYIVKNMKSLADMDVDYLGQMKEAYTPVIRAHFESVVQKIVTHTEDNLFMVRPEMSRPPQTFVAANPDFWTIKAPESATAKAKVKAKKPVKEAEKLEARD